MSQMSREDMLRELELLPVWQLRQPLRMSFNVKTPAADNSEQLVMQQLIEASVFQDTAIKEQQLSVAELPSIDIAIADSAVSEPSISESLIPEPVPSAFEAPVSQLIEVVDSIEEAPNHEPVLEQRLPLPLRLLLSEDSAYAFMMEPYAVAADMQEVEVLLKNMIRAMQTSCREDVTDTADKIFAVHTPKLIISLGAEPANRLLGKSYAVNEWRDMQQEHQPRYRDIPLVVTYHPAHLLENVADKAHAWRDLCVSMKLIQNL